MEQAFVNTVIAFKLMQYSYSLKCFFKKDGYIIPFSHLLHIKRNIFPLIRDACGYVCSYNEQCDGHKFLDFVEELYEFEHYSVIFVLKEIKFMKWKKLKVGIFTRLPQRTYLIFRTHKDYII